MSQKVMDLIKKEEVEFVDLRFSDLRGVEHHVSFPAARFNQQLLECGKVFDGSSIDGWATIDKSDKLLCPVAETAVIDPFCEAKTLNIRCNVFDPDTQQPYQRDPRAVAIRAEKHLKETGLADEVLFGQEVEFFIFDDVRWSIDMSGVSYAVDSHEAAWNSGKIVEGGNLGHRPGVKGGYFPVPPVDSSQDLRSEMCNVLAEVGLVPEVHHHEVATGNQNEICTRYNTLLNKCDEVQIFKYVVRNVAHLYGKSVTFMPKPLIGDNGSAMHCHQSLSKGGKNLFAGDVYAGLSEMALYYIGGVLKHARSLCAFTNPTTNSYKRLIPGFEAPTKLCYSAGNRSAAIRIPYFTAAPESRIEARFPDPLANSYLAFPALLMAGLDGIKNKIHPGDAMDFNLYDLSEAQEKEIPTLCSTLDEALSELKSDHDYLLQGNVFNEDLLGAYLDLRAKESRRLDKYTHPIEFDMYYSN
jgi:glutamine synthetase